MQAKSSINHVTEVAAIYGAQAKDWRENAWLSTTIAFGIWGGIVVFGSVFHIIKHIRIQTIVFMLVCTAFAGALASGNTENKNQSAAFSFLATLPAGILELIPVTLCQLDANDADLGTVFGMVEPVDINELPLTAYSNYLFDENRLGVYIHCRLLGHLVQ